MTIHLGNVPAGSTLYIPFASYDANGASVALSGLATSDIKVVKNGASERANVAGYALLDTDGIDVLSLVGLNGVSIDLADNTVGSFYAVGSFYWVYISSVTIATQTVNVLAATFRIVAAENTAGTPVSDVTRINNVATTSVTAVNANVGTTQPVNFTGTAASATVKSDVTNIATSAVNTAAAQLGVNTVSITNDAITASAIANAAIDAATFAAGAIDANAIAADAIGASELAASAVTEIVTAVLTTQMTEAYAADGAAPTVAQALMLIQQQLGEFTISGTTLTVKKVDGSATAATFTLNDGTSPTAISRTT